MKLASIALPTGPYDWHPERIARAVFDERVAHVRLVMASRGITHLVVHGNGFDHGALAWLTHFTPKLGPAYALLRSKGKPRLLFAGGPGMRPSAARLTWIEDVAALKGLRGDLEGWLSETDGGDRVALGLVEGQAMSRANCLAITAAAGAEPASLDEAIDAMRRYKTGLEQDMLRRASGLLDEAVRVLAKSLPEMGSRSAALAAEAAAYREGAQDIRIRMSKELGQPMLAPGGDDRRASGPIQVEIALRAFGYWVCGQLVTGLGSSRLQQRACDVLKSVLAKLRPGAAQADLESALPKGVSVDCRGLGLSPEEAPWLARGDRLSVADVCAVTVAGRSEDGRRSAWSAVASVGARGADVLWMPPSD